MKSTPLFDQFADTYHVERWRCMFECDNAATTPGYLINIYTIWHGTSSTFILYGILFPGRLYFRSVVCSLIQEFGNYVSTSSRIRCSRVLKYFEGIEVRVRGYENLNWVEV